MKKALSVIFLVHFMFLPLAIYAQSLGNSGLVPCDPLAGKFCTLCDFFKMIANIVNFLLFKIVPPLATLLIALGGVLMIIAYIEGSEGGGRLNQAKKIFSTVLLGLLIIYGAWLIINVFFWAIGVNAWTGLKEGWWNIRCD